MSSDITAALVVTVAALVAMYLWLVVCDVARSLAERRRWRRPFTASEFRARLHPDWFRPEHADNFQPETHTQKEQTS